MADQGFLSVIFRVPGAIYLSGWKIDMNA